MKKINLEEILLKNNVNFYSLNGMFTPDGNNGSQGSRIIEAMKEACKQTLELAAENAIMATKKVLWDDPKEGDDAYMDVPIINKQSILDTISQIE